MAKRLVSVTITKTYYKSATIEVEVDDNIVGKDLRKYLSESTEVDESLDDRIASSHFYDAESEYFYEDKVNEDSGYLFE